jgi:hypothetical protein
MTPFAARYVDFGKVFVPNGALDFSTLAYSDAEAGRFGAQLFNRGLLFPETSPFAGQVGAVTAALLMFEGGYIFSVVQRRREGELSAAPRTDRPFNQARFVLLSRETIEAAFAARSGLYTGLALGARDPEASVWLPDYTAEAGARPFAPFLKRLEAHAPSTEAVRFVANAVMASAERAVVAPGTRASAPPEAQALRPQPISVPLPGHDLLERLQLVEAVQYWLMPRLGVLTFALDYVSVQNVHLRLFELPPDAPAPLPAERVFVPGAPPPRAVEDVFTPLTGLSHEALYDAALPELLALPLGTADAVALFAIEKQGGALAGAEAVRLYPELARLGDRRLKLLRHVPREEALDLLRQPDLRMELRQDLLQVAFEAAHGQLALYAPVHLAAPRLARDTEGVRALLRASVARSPETALSLSAPEHQIELYRDLLLARSAPPLVVKGPPPAGAPTTLTTGQPVLSALLTWRRGAELAAAFEAAVAEDPALFADALSALDTAAPSVADLRGVLWLWQCAGQGDFKRYCAMLERLVQPVWYPALGREPGTWRQLLAEGRALALSAEEAATTDSAEAVSETGALLRALPRQLVPFVWQASLATAERDGVFAEWWLFNEALAVPEQLDALWAAVQQAPAATLDAASPALNYLLGRRIGLSLIEACTPPGHDRPDEALYATVLRAWLEADFHLPAGDAVLASEDIEFLISNLPGSNEILAAVAASPAQTQAIRGLSSASAQQWLQAAQGERRQPYRADGKDLLFQRLMELPAADEALLWRVLVEDEGSSAPEMSWAEYSGLLGRVRERLGKASGRLAEPSRLEAYLEAAARVAGHDLPALFAENRMDLRRVLRLVATHPSDGDDIPTPVPANQLLPLAVFHVQADDPALVERAGDLLRAGLRQTDVIPHLQALPDNVLAYLRTTFCVGDPALDAAGHWIEAELSRRTDAYRVERLLRPAPTRRQGIAAAAAQGATTLPGPAPEAAPRNTAPATLELPGARRLPKAPRLTAARQASAPPPPPPSPDAAMPAEPQSLLGELALPDAAPAGRDSATWLWVAIVVVAVLILGVLIGAAVVIQSLAS